MFYTLFGITIYILFFILLPGVGAILLRRKWTNFRLQVLEYSGYPELRYDNIKDGNMYYFTGQLESLRDDNSVWLKSESLSICINLHHKHIYNVDSSGKELRRNSWRQFSSLVEGTRFYVFGKLKLIKGVPYLIEDDKKNFIVALYEEDEPIFEMLMKNGRDRNEIWNNSSPYFYITGVFILIILSYFSYKTKFNKTESFFLLLAAGTPFYFIIPPGLISYLRYRKLWDLSVRFNILKDLKKLKGYDKSSKFMGYKSKSREQLSLLFYVAGYIINIFIAGIILFNLYQFIIFN